MGKLVSIIIPTYKGCDKLPRAIDSALSQTYENIEIIVVDDNDPGSAGRQETEEIMRGYCEDHKCISYIKREQNGGIASAKNTGILAAKGYYISFLDDDDYYLDERVKRCVEYLEEHNSYVGVYTGVDVYDSYGYKILRLRPDKNLTIRELLMNVMAMGTGSNTFIRREYAEMVGMHDESFVRRTDIEFTIRLCKCGEIGYITDCQVVKTTRANLNVPSYEKYKEVLNKFFNKFEADIETLGDDKDEFYRRQYNGILSIAMKERDNDEIRESYNLVKKYGGVSLGKRIVIWLHLHNLRDTVVVNALVSFARRLRNIKNVFC